MLTSMVDVLKKAQEGNYAICSFNVYNYETTKGVIDAANKVNVPIIIALGENYLKQFDSDITYSMVSVLADKSDVPIVLHLDHCSCIDNIYTAIEAGFTSVMYDGSRLPIEENIMNTARVVEYAHKRGVSVEGEIGTLETGIHSSESFLSDKLSYSDPDTAKRFTDNTEVDALAVSIGTVHGLYKHTPNIRIDILKKIHEKVDIPLVLHGGSGTDKDVLINCIKNGIRKININTDISVYTVKELKKFLDVENLPHLSVMSKRQTELVTVIAEKYINLLRYGK